MCETFFNIVDVQCLMFNVFERWDSAKTYQRSGTATTETGLTAKFHLIEKCLSKYKQ